MGSNPIYIYIRYCLSCGFILIRKMFCSKIVLAQRNLKARGGNRGHETLRNRRVSNKQIGNYDKMPGEALNRGFIGEEQIFNGVRSGSPSQLGNPAKLANPPETTKTNDDPIFGSED